MPNELNKPLFLKAARIASGFTIVVLLVLLAAVFDRPGERQPASTNVSTETFGRSTKASTKRTDELVEVKDWGGRWHSFLPAGFEVAPWSQPHAFRAGFLSPFYSTLFPAQFEIIKSGSSLKRFPDMIVSLAWVGPDANVPAFYARLLEEVNKRFERKYYDIELRSHTNPKTRSTSWSLDFSGGDNKPYRIEEANYGTIPEGIHYIVLKDGWLIDIESQYWTFYDHESNEFDSPDGYFIDNFKPLAPESRFHDQSFLELEAADTKGWKRHHGDKFDDRPCHVSFSYPDDRAHVYLPYDDGDGFVPIDPERECLPSVGIKWKDGDYSDNDARIDFYLAPSSGIPFDKFVATSTTGFVADSEREMSVGGRRAIRLVGRGGSGIGGSWSLSEYTVMTLYFVDLGQEVLLAAFPATTEYGNPNVEENRKLFEWVISTISFD